MVGGVEVAQDDDGRGIDGLSLASGHCGLGPVDVDDLRLVDGPRGERGLTWQRDGLDPHEDGDVVGGAVRRLLEDRRAERVLRDEAVEVAVFQEDGIRRARGTDEARGPIVRVVEAFREIEALRVAGVVPPVPRVVVPDGVGGVGVRTEQIARLRRGTLKQID